MLSWTLPGSLGIIASGSGLKRAGGAEEARVSEEEVWVVSCGLTSRDSAEEESGAERSRSRLLVRSADASPPSTASR